MRHVHLKRYRDRKGEWRWTLYATNGRKIACSGEGYTRRANMDRILYKLFPWFWHQDPHFK